ncbi:SmdA family multidrug ABC transporter permease/ATP-binding protein [Buchnera aphidicola (Pemphigus obesinymphae)]|uniref:SmdA family multidrug ABC transporter permease/ATP-binding protein n=1 Tax=Buchnera aphidicola TaxID=9 RepID=UPI0022379ED8|nr:SmdA family multidrug ABC transporter permease/ATP-binding protein [Buchnera aphidicola]MCW5196381.1 SmdA family multidrug ABC transporter permease/ATP-binding protein [Buchnera aphidicola (Pemphigus obesinymphae)]
MQLFNQLSWYFIREWKRYLGAIFLLIIIAILQLLPPKVVGMLVDLVMKNKINNMQILYWIIVMLFTALLVYILRYMWRVLLFGAAYKLAVELRIQFYNYLSFQNSMFYLKNRTGDLMARATNDVDKVVFAAGEGVLTLVDSLIMGISVLIIMFTQISWKLTLLSLIPMPIMALIIKTYGKELHSTFRKAQAAFSVLTNQTQESLTNIRMIKAFGLELEQCKKFDQVAQIAGQKNMEVAKIDAKFDPTIHLGISLSNLIAITGGGYLIWNKEITLGQLTSFIMYLGLMVWPMLALAWMFNIVERGSAAWERIQLIIGDKISNSQKNNKKFPSTPCILEIKINNFTYPKSKKNALNKIFFKLYPGKILGICGPTGSGKSTLLNLIQKQFDIKNGNISYNNIPLSHYEIKLWRHRIAMVNQTSFLFSDTIYNNISLGKPHATKKEIEKSAYLANIHQEILNLPKGYDTQVGERGIMLSGGQKQRIAIARALLTNTEILILDDALSAVDGECQQIILKNINKWKTNKHTLIIIAHRLSTLINADNIVVLENGSISQIGNHSELMKEKKWYNKMYNYQKLNI